ncbi:glycoside hydrolase superfamily [Radiomyces spectabilis]|uniref:glycoside hydrolase superfamily n=1 Tax=Radiomyces spectabilis TaxID=64574 RepID=UPI00221FB808|nr:glycoside hydrolase superfamily [Radiomyces spectabilis]XP_051424386.1 glycoside hydrolase superfamily [Radiomyces spectabilis]KAI8364132.1 glycoside hydrolase superfamily [Radiomyces spectabilis]KAI8381103.1 glycoside hydrolase superfamily [Radiomyces spectabilis]
MMDLDGPWFIERATNRTVLFRGVNVGGGAKLPVGIPSHVNDGYWIDHDRNISMVGRPFPIEEADDHLQRLVVLGFNLLRFLVTWEAIEHEGPGIYDQQYLEYVIQLLDKCKAFNLKVYIDPHQDAWSRHCGGSGHPGWTHSLVGLNPLNFQVTNAAIVHNLYPEPDQFPKMIWNTNYQRLAASTMFTLFFAGKIYAPKCHVNGVHVQDYLQSHYFRAIEALTNRIHQHGGLEDTTVLGYDTMNEPGQGYVGLLDIRNLRDNDLDFKKGLMPTAFQGMVLGSGYATHVQNWKFTWSGPKKVEDVYVDPQGTSAWLSEPELEAADRSFGWTRSDAWSPGCIWALHGVWDKETQTVLQPHYFSMNPVTGEPADYSQHWIQFLQSYAKMLRSIHREAIIFVQPPTLETPPKIPTSLPRLVYAPHWYDGLTLVKKKWCSYNVDVINLSRGKYGTGPMRFLRALRLGEKAIRQCFVDQLATIQQEGWDNVGPYPCILGEIGIPYDMEPAKSNALQVLWGWILFWCVYSETGQASVIGTPEAPQNKAMDANLNALEANLLNYTLWHYVPDNDPIWGDRWDGEDLSIWQSEGPPSYGGSSRTLVDEVSHGKYKKNPDISPWNDESDLESASDDQPTARLIPDTNVRDVISLHRPHPWKVAGIPVSIQFISPTNRHHAAYFFTYKRREDELVSGPTEIYVPTCHFATPESDDKKKTKISLSHGYWECKVINDHYWILLWWVDDKEAGSQFELKLECI